MVDKKFKPMDELGVTGLKRYGGYVFEEFLKELSGFRGIKVYEEMEKNDPVVGAFLFATKMLIRNVKWTVNPVSNEKQDEDNAEFLRECMKDMSHSWTSMISEILSFLPYGWSWHETVYKRRLGDHRDPSKRSAYKDGKIGWRKIPIRSQNSLLEWVFDDEGGVQAMKQQAPPDYKTRTIPIDKSLLFRTMSNKGDPEGRSVLRNAYRPWFLKRSIENIEAVGVERDLAGLPVAHVPPEILHANADGTEKATRQAIEKVVKNIRRDEQEGLLFPLAYDESGNPLFKLELLSTGGRRQFDTSKIVDRYDVRILITVIADFILLGHQKVGSFALSSDKTTLFATAIGAWLEEIAEVFNRFGIPRLFKLNGVTGPYPELAYSDIETVDLEVLSNFISKLSASGMEFFPDKTLENHLRKQASMPLTTEE